jgi:hypothetical protein
MPSTDGSFHFLELVTASRAPRPGGHLCTRRGAALLAAWAVAAGGAGAGCRGGPERPDAAVPDAGLAPAAGAGAAAPAARRYTVRAQVVALPRPHAHVRQLTVRHEAIPGFVDREGATVRMPSMVMALDLAPTVSLSGVAPDDKVELTLLVDWDRPLVRIERLRKLPDETPLRLESP